MSHARKNILFLMTDQHRPDHVGYAPDATLATPNLDRLAEGAVFHNAVTPNPICTPARTALLTGKYTHQIGTLAMSGDLSSQHPTYMRALQSSGYWTAGIGKFHWLQGWPWGEPEGEGHPLASMHESMKRFGFDHIWEAAGKQLAYHNTCDYCEHLRERGLLEAYRAYVNPAGKNSGDAQKLVFEVEPWTHAEEDYVEHVIADKVIDAIRDRPQEKPFCIFGSFLSPHAPFDPPISYLERFPLEEEDDFLVDDAQPPMSPELKTRLYELRRAYKAMVACVDDQVGRILDALERDGLLEETVILFTSDHGEMMGDRGLLQKCFPWRASAVVPTAIRHPDHLDARVVKAPIETTDLTATMLDVAGLDPAEALSKPWPAYHERVPCRSLLPILRGEAAAVREAAFCECMNRWRMLQSEEWKYIRYLEPLDVDRTAAGAEHLYHLPIDPNELVDRAGDPACREVLEQMRARERDVMDATPPAQLQWAPYGANPAPWP